MARIRNSTSSLAWLAAITLMCIASKTLAATRTICLEFQIRDERSRCPTPGTTGAVRPCDPAGDYVNPVGMGYELWDKDDTSAEDDYIGTWNIGGTGSRCATFEWENASYSSGEAHPDVYPKLLPRVRSTGASSGAFGRAADAAGTWSPKTTFRETHNGSHVYWNCSGTCSLPGGVLVPTHSSTSDMGQRFQMMDSAQRVFQLFNGILDSGDVKLRYPGEGCPDGRSTARNDLCIPSGKGSIGDLVTHEMGHIVQTQMFNQDVLQNVIRDDAWTMASDSFETESAATQEGWAAYVAALAWYDPLNDAVAPLFDGVNIETAALAQTNCAGNITIPRQGAKAFWDFTDHNNEGGTRSGVADDDRSCEPAVWVAKKWDEFPDGTDNREDYETGSEGVNVRDYLFYVDDSLAHETMLQHNCLVGQTDD